MTCIQLEKEDNHPFEFIKLACVLNTIICVMVLVHKSNVKMYINPCIWHFCNWKIYIYTETVTLVKLVLWSLHVTSVICIISKLWVTIITITVICNLSKLTNYRNALQCPVIYIWYQYIYLFTLFIGHVALPEVMVHLEMAPYTLLNLTNFLFKCK